MQDSFENFAEQLWSFELLEAHRHALAADTVEFTREHPGVPAVELILDADASEAVPLRTASRRRPGRTSPEEASSGWHRASSSCTSSTPTTPPPSTRSKSPEAKAHHAGCRWSRRSPGVRLSHVDYELEP